MVRARMLPVATKIVIGCHLESFTIFERLIDDAAESRSSPRRSISALPFIALEAG